jgi:hypothetical protein
MGQVIRRLLPTSLSDREIDSTIFYVKAQIEDAHARERRMLQMVIDEDNRVVMELEANSLETSLHHLHDLLNALYKAKTMSEAVEREQAGALVRQLARTTTKKAVVATKSLNDTRREQDRLNETYTEYEDIRQEALDEKEDEVNDKGSALDRLRRRYEKKKTVETEDTVEEKAEKKWPEEEKKGTTKKRETSLAATGQPSTSSGLLADAFETIELTAKDNLSLVAT